MPLTTLVLGASLNANRYSYQAIMSLKDHSIEVKAIGLKSGVVHGVNIVSSMEAFQNIHTVSLYLNPKRQEFYYDYVLELKPKRVIFNPGTENPEFFQKLKNSGIDIEVACTLVLLRTNQY